jgi:hypothetical protein
MEKAIILMMVFISSLASAQAPYVVSGIDVTLSTYQGYNVSPRTSPHEVSITNSRFRQPTTSGYILQSGDDSYDESTALNLISPLISGNYLEYTGVVGEGSTHSIIAGYNLDYSIKYNYFEGAFYGIVAEGGYDSGLPMVHSAYHISHNIFYNNTSPLNITGQDGVEVYNNTVFYGLSGSSWIVKIGDSNGTAIPAPAKNIKIKNNIFYTVSSDHLMVVTEGSHLGFECDYNLYYCEECNGNQPRFNFRGVVYTWEQWQELGYDTHSVIINPDFIDLINFVPAARLDYGVDLGPDFEDGLSPEAAWEVGVSPATTKQYGTWQVGAIIYESEASDGGLIEDGGSDSDGENTTQDDSDLAFETEADAEADGRCRSRCRCRNRSRTSRITWWLPMLDPRRLFDLGGAAHTLGGNKISPTRQMNDCVYCLDYIKAQVLLHHILNTPNQEQNHYKAILHLYPRLLS